jgi:hypothetical protein
MDLLRQVAHRARAHGRSKYSALGRLPRVLLDMLSVWLKLHFQVRGAGSMFSHSGGSRGNYGGCLKEEHAECGECLVAERESAVGAHRKYVSLAEAASTAAAGKSHRS